MILKNSVPFPLKILILHNMKKRILIIEDDLAFGTMLQGWFSKNGYEPVFCMSIKNAKAELHKNSFDLVLSDLRLPDGDGIMLLHWVKDNKMEMPFMIMTSYGEITTAVAAMKLGAEDYLEKPINPTILRKKIENALSKKNIEYPDKKERKINAEYKGMVTGKSRAAKTMFDHIMRVAPTRMTVLILGESGTGKEYAARLIHDNSSRKDNPYIAVDCGSLSKELAPSELFGHLKGSFTSAISDKTGVFEQAKGGTVFLDEVGNLSYEVQVQLLRALQEQKVRPVGSTKDINIDVRILAATNEDLEKAISEGKFREDLFHRLNEFAVTVPPLRERKGDIKLFADEFLRQANDELERNITGFSEETMEYLEKQYWGGNLRELRNAIRRAALFASGNEIEIEDLPVLSQKPSTGFSQKGEDLALRPGNEKEQIENVLQRARGNKTLAAQLLKIDRKTLYNKMHQYGIDI